MKENRFLSGILSLTLCASLILSGCSSSEADVSETMAEGQSVPQLSVSETTLVSEPKYEARKDIETILFIGLDKFESEEYEFGYLNDQQCDFLMLFILDEKDQVCDVLHLNRDTMTEIRRLGVGGKNAGKFTGQLALAHTYGSGGSDSCLNTTRAVSKFLKGVKVDHYVAMPMAGVGKLNDLVGGVEVTIPVDMTAVDPAFQEGATVLLQGDQALSFVRARGSLEDSSNISRMERQRLYLGALYEKLLFSSHEDSGFVKHSLLEMTTYMQSDMSINQLSAMADVMENCTLNPFTTIDGEAIVGEDFMEFYADEDSLTDVLISLFTE